MCQICRRTPCDCRCPNVKESKPAHTCINCGDGIYAGQKMFASWRGPICEDCMEDMTASELLVHLDERMEIVNE